jgi:hypothetical protein
MKNEEKIHEELGRLSILHAPADACLELGHVGFDPRR